MYNASINQFYFTLLGTFFKSRSITSQHYIQSILIDHQQQRDSYFFLTKHVTANPCFLFSECIFQVYTKKHKYQNPTKNSCVHNLCYVGHDHKSSPTDRYIINHYYSLLNLLLGRSAQTIYTHPTLRNLLQTDFFSRSARVVEMCRDGKMPYVRVLNADR